MEEVVKGTGEETGTTVTSTDDEFGYRWMVLDDPDMEDLVVGVNAVSTAIQGGGYGDRVLCAVFALHATTRGKHIYWIYNYKRGAFYPFVPAGGAQQRDNERELRLKAQIGADLPIEAELERWFPLWGIPIPRRSADCRDDDQSRASVVSGSPVEAAPALGLGEARRARPSRSSSVAV